MSDLKLFKLTADLVTELTVSSMALEKSLQTQIEKHLDTDPLVKCKEEAKHDFCRTKETILQIYDTLAETR